MLQLVAAQWIQIHLELAEVSRKGDVQTESFASVCRLTTMESPIELWVRQDDQDDNLAGDIRSVVSWCYFW